MKSVVPDEALDQLFREARTYVFVRRIPDLSGERPPIVTA